MSNLNRRRFLQQGAATGLALAWAGRSVAASERLGAACIGVRGQGNALLRTFAAQPDIELRTICDIDEALREMRATETEKSTGRRPKTVNDYRAVLDDKGIDLVVIGTPDHWHALPAIHACLAGKDVYVEKPDGHNIIEGQTMVAAARKHNRMMQLGTQSRSAPDLFAAVEYVRAGNLGKVLFGKAWETDRQGAVARVPDSTPPKGVDYDLWLGPAPKRAFNRSRFHGNWRWFFDYGTGDLGNDGVHRLDFCRWVMGITDLPQTVSSAGGKFFFDDAQEWPDTLMTTYEYPGKILTYEMRLWSKPRLLECTEGAAVHGDEGWMLINNAGWKAYDGKGKLVKEMGGRSPLGLHIRNFLEAVRSRKRASLNQEIASGHVSSFLCHAGNIAWRTGKKLKVDAKTETFDDRDANKYLGREYRKGFELPKV
jgi:predicted dehydrogenase